MSLPDWVFSSPLVFFASALGAALLGGWHCAGMCGPIATLATRPRSAFLHQAGRLTAYLSLGLLASVFGERALSAIPTEKRWFVSLILGGLSFWILLSVWKFDFVSRAQAWVWRNRPRKYPTADYFSLGLLNGLLPCTWVYGFLVIAAGLGRRDLALLLLFSLWLGSLPWLLAFSFLGDKIRRHSVRTPWLERTLLAAVVMGLLAQSFHG